jgi:hypothetical protein
MAYLEPEYKMPCGKTDGPDEEILQLLLCKYKA